MTKKIIFTDQAPAPIGPYSQAVLSGRTLYVSGQIPTDPATGELISGNIQREAEQVMDNLGAILDSAGMNFNDVVKCTIFVKDLNDFGAINETYGSYFRQEAPPARETVEVNQLPKNVNVEISCIAEKK